MRDASDEDPNSYCARCARGRRWHWLFYLLYAIKYFVKNKYLAIKLIPATVRKVYRFKKYPHYKISMYRNIKSLLLGKRYKACKKFRLQHPRALQIKSKYGGLRFYMTHGTDRIFELIDKAEDKSYETCEKCGKPGKARDVGWIWTLCDECYERKMNENR
jgi:hypothetical protein